MYKVPDLYYEPDVEVELTKLYQDADLELVARVSESCRVRFRSYYHHYPCQSVLGCDFFDT